nr:hypothetical protein [Candidatus Sigynarchaeota archaeon]
MTLGNTIKDLIASLLKAIPLILASVVFLALLGSGLGLAIVLRSAGLDFGAIIIPSIIIEIICCIIAYQLFSNFFQKPEREFVEDDDAGLPARKGKA